MRIQTAAPPLLPSVATCNAPTPRLNPVDTVATRTSRTCAAASCVTQTVMYTPTSCLHASRVNRRLDEFGSILVSPS